MTLPVEDKSYPSEKDLLERSVQTLSESLVIAGHDVVVCSPYKDSVDYYAIVRVADMLNKDPELKATVEVHYPDEPSVSAEVRKVKEETNFEQMRLFSHICPSDLQTRESQSYSWLLAQINALNGSNMVVALGGRLDGPATLLLRLAEANRRPILPLRFMGGAAARIYDRLQYELQDKLRDDFPVLNDEGRVSEVSRLVEKLAGVSGQNLISNDYQEFFISYARARPEEADHIETLLRRRNFTVYRDEEDFKPGTLTYEEIKQHIYKADVFVAVWCQEYACSPWCYDELQLALDRLDAGSIKLWLIRVDKTRIVPPGARELIYFDARNRSELEGKILHLLHASDDGESVSEDS